MEEKKKRGLSVRSDFLQEIRDIAMKMVEAVYFIFFLPLSAIENTEISNLILVTSYTSIFSLLNLFFFAFIYLINKKNQQWKIEIQLKGYWVEIFETQKE